MIGTRLEGEPAEDDPVRRKAIRTRRNRFIRTLLPATALSTESAYSI